MKKIFIAGIQGIIILSCSKKENMADVAVYLETAIVSEPAVSDLSAGQIIKTLDCSSCHSVNERMIGPSYQEIAGKYSEKDTDLLVSKIIEGGSGVWGSLPMIAHPQVSKEDAQKMVKYILSQKK